MKVQPWGGDVVDRADQLPIAMRADAKAADIAIGSQAEAVGEIQMIAPAEERIAPAGRAIDARSGVYPGVQGQVRRKSPRTKAAAQVRILGRCSVEEVEQ